MQCLDCGQQVRPVRRDEAAERAAAAANPAFDMGWMEASAARVRDAWQAYNAERSRAWEAQQARQRRDYAAYLASDAWQRRRLRRLVLDQYRCQAMLAVCTVHASEVHHRTYDHIYNEPMFDLISVCGACHRQITAMDRGEASDRLSA